MQGAEAPAIQSTSALLLQDPENIPSAEGQLLWGLSRVVIESPGQLGLWVRGGEDKGLHTMQVPWSSLQVKNLTPDLALLPALACLSS